jgi:hypothetical protein
MKQAALHLLTNIEDLAVELKLHIEEADNGSKTAQRTMSKASFRLVRNATAIKNIIKELKPYGKKF